MHLFDVARRFYGGSAIVGGGLPVAVGLALAEKLQKRHGIVVCFFGEGAMAEGEFHESMNLAALWQLPVLFVCENNYYAMGTALARSEAETDLVAKARSYHMHATTVDGMDVLAVERTAREIIEQIRATKAPAFLEARTYRLRAHSMYDPQLYRSREEVQEWERHGPLTTLTTQLKAQGLMTEEDFVELRRAAVAEVDAAVAFAEAAPLEAVSDLERFVYAEARP